MLRLLVQGGPTASEDDRIPQQALQVRRKQACKTNVVRICGRGGTADKERDHYRLDAFVALNEIYSAIFDARLRMTVAEVRRLRAREKSASPLKHLRAASAKRLKEANGKREVGWWAMGTAGCWQTDGAHGSPGGEGKHI